MRYTEWSFAAPDGRYPAEDKGVAGPLGAIIRDVAALNQHLSPFHKKKLTSSFGRFNDTWSPKIAGKLLAELTLLLDRHEGRHNPRR